MSSLHQYEQVIKDVHDHLYANANIRTPEELQLEVSKVLRAVILGKQKGALPQLTADAVNDLKHGHGLPVFQEATNIRALFEETSDGKEAILLDDASLAYIRGAFSSFSFEGLERDWMGDALEVFRSTEAKRLGGQFFTDQRVTELALDLLEFDPVNHDLVDICAGTGGFLLAGHKRARLSGCFDTDIKGVEIDPKLARLGNVTISQFGYQASDRIFTGDSLRSGLEWSPVLRKDIVDGTVKRLASNPPFGIKITIKDTDLLERFDLGRVWSKDRTTGVWNQTSRIVPRPPDILFLERNLQLAEPGVGRAAIVTPYQILSGPKLGFVREWLLRHAKIIAVIDLPDDTFQPWTGTKTSLTVYERRAQPLKSWKSEVEDYPIFMAVASDIGHDRRGKPVLTSDGEIKTDLPEIAKAFAAWRKGENPTSLHPNSFEISSKRLTQDGDLRLNSAYYLPSASGARDVLSANGHDEFEVVPLGDLVSKIFCPGRFRRNYVEDPNEGTLFLGGSNITQIIPTNRKYLSNDDAHLEEMLVESGWVLVTRSGTTGIVSSVPDPWHNKAMSEHIIRIVPNDNRIPAGYIESYLRSNLGQKLIAAGVFGSVIDEITPEFLAKLPVPVPRDKELINHVSNTQKKANDARSAAMALISQSLDATDEFHALHLE